MTYYCFHTTFTDSSKGDLVIHIISHYAQKEPRRFLGVMAVSRTGPR